MKNTSNFLNKVYLLVFSMFISILSHAQTPPSPAPPGGGAGGTHPGTQPGNVPIDMYEAGLLLIAVSLVITYYYYQKNKKVSL